MPSLRLMPSSSVPGIMSGGHPRVPTARGSWPHASLSSRPSLSPSIPAHRLPPLVPQLLLPLLPDILADIPTGSPPAHHAAALRRRTHVMRIFLQELFFASREGTHPASANATLGPEILKALFASPDSEGPSAAAEPAAVRLLRATAAGAHMDAPDLPAALLGPLPAGVAQAVAHVAERRGVEVGGVWGVAEDGRRGVDQRTLQEQVAAAARDGGVSEDVWSGLMWYAEALTSAEEELWCRSQLFEAWRSVVEVSFTLCFQQVGSLSCPLTL